MELEGKRRSWVVKLSGGQKQRLSIACALAGDPDLLFLDEPTTGLDPQSRRQLWNILTRFREAGGTVVLTTHYMDEAETLCDRVAIVDHGRVIAEDTPKGLIASLGCTEGRRPPGHARRRVHVADRPASARGVGSSCLLRRATRTYPPLVELTLARLREFVREPEALFWTFLFPIVMSVAMAIAFPASGGQTVRVGVAPGPASEALRQPLAGAQDVVVRELPPDDADCVRCATATCT